MDLEKFNLNDSIILVDKAIPTTLLARNIRDKLTIILVRSGVGQTAIDDLLLAASEHLTNLSKHSHSKECSVYWLMEQQCLIIEDNGLNISHLWKESSILSDDTDSLSLHESGMGISIIKSVCPNYSYQSNKQQTNQLRLPLPAYKPIIAVIDDDDVFLSLIEFYLKDHYSVISFSSSSEALASTELHQASLILCDVHMPKIHGHSIRETLLNNESSALIPFIFLTGDLSASSRSLASEMLIDDYLTKPIDKDILQDTIKRILLRSNRLQQQLNEKMDQTINQSLWPKGPWCNDYLNLEYCYQVATRGGGDFFFFDKTSKTLRFILGDVMGHGEQAKFFAFAISGLLIGLCGTLSSQQSLEAFMEKISDAMYECDLMNQTLVTLQAIEIDKNKVTICNAGHPLPILINQKGDINVLEVIGSLPGLDKQTTYHSKTVTLNSEQSLLLYTDGLVEALLSIDKEDALLELLNNLNQNNHKPIDAQYLFDFFALDKRKIDDDVSIVSITQKSGIN